MKIDRRAVLAGIAAAGAWSSTAWAKGRYPWQLGVQLWAVQDELETDFAGTLHALSALGFREVETAGLHGRTPVAFAEAMARAGLRVVGAHYSLDALVGRSDEFIGETKALGAQYLVCSSPRPGRPLDPEKAWAAAIHDAMTAAAWRDNAEALNRIGARAKAAGLTLAYHNHPAEFDLYEGRRGFDWLLAGTDPDLVKFELDIAWAVAGGIDPVSLLGRHPGRFRLIHLKGLRTLPPAGRYGTDFRTGALGTEDAIAWPAIIDAARRAGVRHAFVEQERPHDHPVLDTLAACANYLRAL